MAKKLINDKLREEIRGIGGGEKEKQILRELLELEIGGIEGRQPEISHYEKIIDKHMQ